MPRASRKLILEALEELYRRMRVPVRPADVYRYLREKGIAISERSVREALAHYAKVGVLERIESAPNKVYYKPRRDRSAPRVRRLDEFVIMTPKTSEEASAEVEAHEETERLSKTIAGQIARRLKETGKLSFLVRRHAGDLANKDPIELTIGLVRSLCRGFYETTQDPHRYVVVVEVSKYVVWRWLASVLGVPVLALRKGHARKVKEWLRVQGVPEENAVNVLCGKAEEILDLIASPATAAAFGVEQEAGGEGHSFFMYSEARLKRVLARRIVDDRLVVEAEVAPSREVVYVAGHDTSSWPILIHPEIVLGYPGPPEEVYVLAGVIYKTWRAARGNRTYHVSEVVPHPRSLGELDRTDAIDRGFIVTPDMLEEAGRGGRRVVEAAMNVLEYSIISEELTARPGPRGLVIDGDYTEKPSFEPRPIYHDGRLFPYEHRIDDYAGGYGEAHTRLVRAGFARFRSILRAVASDERVVIVGVVKRPYSPTVYPLILYGLREAGAIDDWELWRLLQLGAALERYIVADLLTAVYEVRREQLGSGKILRTVAIVRRLWAMDDKLMRAFTDRTYGARSLDDESQESFWLEKAVVEKEQLDEDVDCGTGIRGYLCMKGINGGPYDDILAYVLANASAAVTYVLPPPNDVVDLNYLKKVRERLALPRYEVLVPPPRSADLERYREGVRQRLARAVLPRIPGLADYDVPEIIDEKWGRPFKFLTLVPRHIFMADAYVKKFDAMLRDAYYSRLLEQLKRILHDGGGES